MGTTCDKIKGILASKIFVSAFFIPGLLITMLEIPGCRSGETQTGKRNELSGSEKQKSTLQSVIATGSDMNARHKSTVTTAPFYWAWWGWEPLEHNVRLGGPSYTVDGSAWWASKWYDRLHSEELVRKMAGLGVNLAVTHFFKGFGLRFEHAQQQNTAKLVRYAHQNGIKVLGYCQFRSLYYETFLNEEPQAFNWLKRKPDGGFVYWSEQQYYRWFPCINSPDFRAYLKKAIRIGLKEIHLDGFNFDNCTNNPCYCEKCEKLFRTWLSERYPHPIGLFGIDSFDSIKLPPTPSSDGQIHDPLIRAWIRWRCENLEEFVRDITGYARSIRPDVILMANPGHPTSALEPLRKGVWPPMVGRYLDLMITENADSPEIDGDLMISQIRAHKQGTAVGYRAVPTTWAEGPKENKSDASTQLPQSSTVIQLQVAEAAANKGVPGANWATRALGGGDGMRIDVPEFSDALGHYLGFVMKNDSLTRHSRPVNDIAVLHDFASHAFNPRYAWDQVSAAEEILIRGGFSWEVVFDDDLSKLNNYSILILAGQTHLSDQTCSAVKDFACHNGKVIFIGENGLYDDEGRLPAEKRLNNLPDSQIIRFEASEIRKVSDRQWGVFARLPQNRKQIASATEIAASGRLAVRLQDASEVAVSAYRGDKDQLIVHLVNYAAPLKSKPLHIEIGTNWSKSNKVKLICPGIEDLILHPRHVGNHNFVDIPSLDVYGILVVE